MLNEMAEVRAHAQTCLRRASMAVEEMTVAPRALPRDPTRGYPEEGPSKPLQTPMFRGSIKEESLPAQAVPTKKKKLIEAAYCVVCNIRMNDVARDG